MVGKAVIPAKDEMFSTRPRPAGEHARQDLATELDGSDDVERVGLEGDPCGLVDQPADRRDGGVVDDDVERPALGLDSLDEAVELAAVGQVDGERGAVEIGRELLERLGGAGHQRDPGAAAGELAGDLHADALGCPGDERVGPGERQPVGHRFSPDRRAGRPR